MKDKRTNKEKKNAVVKRPLFKKEELTIKNKKDITKARELWKQLGDIPINEEEEIEETFLHFEIGTDRYTIWHWLEDKFDISVAKDLMRIN